MGKITAKVELSSKPNKEGLHPLYIRITANRKLQRVATGYAIPLSDWNIQLDKNRKPVLSSKGKPIPAGNSAKANWVKSTHLDHRLINTGLKQKLLEAEQMILKSNVNQTAISSEAIIRKIRRGEDTNDKVDFFKYAQRVLFDLGSTNYNTRNNAEVALAHLRNFAGEPLEFDQIKPALVNDFVAYLKKLQFRNKEGMKDSTIAKVLATLKKVYNKALEEEIIPNQSNPFNKVTLQIKRSKKEKLSGKTIRCRDQAASMFRP